MKIKTIFFDIDNTLLNYTEAEGNALHIINKKYFPNENYSEFKKVWIEQLKKNWLLYEQHKCTFEEQGINRIKDIWKVLGKDITDKKALGIFNEHIRNFEKSWKIFPHVREILNLLSKKGIRIGVITNGNKPQQIKKLKTIKLDHLIHEDLIVISEEIKFSKPHKKIFQHAQKVAKVKPEHILFVGDNFEIDIEPARLLKWNTLHIDHFSQAETHDFRNILTII